MPPQLRRLLQIVFLLVLAGFLNGCLKEVEQTFTINPDGSGKVQMRIVLEPPTKLNQPEDPDQLLKSTMKNKLEGMKGVEALKNLSYRWREDGTIFFSGTAYFPDLQNLDLNVSHSIKRKYKNLSKNENEAEQYLLKIEDTEKSTDETTGFNQQEGASEQELSLRVAIAKKQFETIRPLLEMKETYKVDDTYRLPGPVSSMENVEQKSPRTVHFRFDGNKRLNALKRLVRDEDQVQRLIKNDNKGESLNFSDIIQKQKTEQAHDLLKTGTIRGTVKMKSQFPYEKQVREARKQSEKQLRELGIEPNELFTTSEQKGDNAAEGNQNEGQSDKQLAGNLRLENIQPVKLRIRNDEEESQFVELEMDGVTIDEGMDIYFEGQLNKPVLELSGGTLKAFHLAGETGQQKSKLVVHDLNEKGTGVEFAVETDVPTGDLSSVKKLSGTINVIRSTGVEKTNLGFDRIEKDAKGTKLNAKIIDLEKQNRGKTTIRLKLDVPSNRMKGLQVVEPPNNVLETSIASTDDHSENGTTYTLKVNGSPSKHDRIFVRYHRAGEPEPVPFSASDLSLLGEDEGK